MSSSAVTTPSQLSSFSGSASAFGDPKSHTNELHSSGQGPSSSTPSTSAAAASSSSSSAPDNEPGTTIVSCKQCGSTELDSDPSRGDTVCMSCGYVLEESLIVSEVCFEEDGHGGASAIGQFVSSESKGGGGIGLSGGPGGGSYHQGIGKESREITLRAAKRKITEVAQQLRLNQHCIDMSFNFFKMALHKQLTKGRRHPLTVAACIYMTCRIEGTPHLLIDFSDVVQMDIYALGRAYSQLSRALFINIPAVDPCMYILRFAHKFNLGKKTHEVGMTAVRLVQRMKRDWLHLGRRPSGLCGAALLIAARLHNFSRTVQDVIQVVKVHETTLRKRLIEFGETPSSSLTIEEFMSVDLEEEHDPPSFKVARIKDREQLQRLMEQEDVQLEMTDLQRKIEEELEKRRRVRGGKDFQAAIGGGGAMTIALPRALGLEGVGLEPGAVSVSGVELESASRFIIDSTLSTINTIINDKDRPFPCSSLSMDPRSPVKIEGQKPGVRTRSRTRSHSGGASASVSGVGSPMDMDRILMPPPSPAPTSTSTTVLHRPTNLSLAPPTPPPPSPSYAMDQRRLSLTKEESGAEDEHEDADGEDGDGGGELDFSDIDDAEIDSYIMSDAEAERKRVLWERLNKEYIVEQERKRAQMEQDILDGKFDKKGARKVATSASGAKVPKGPSTIAGGSTFQAKSASEAIKIMLTERKMSSKINYDVLRKLASSVAGDDEGAGPAGTAAVKEDKDDRDQKEPLVTVIESGPIIPASKRKREVKEEPTPEKKPKISTSKAATTVKEEKYKVKEEDKVKREVASKSKRPRTEPEIAETSSEPPESKLRARVEDHENEPEEEESSEEDEEEDQDEDEDQEDMEDEEQEDEGVEDEDEDAEPEEQEGEAEAPDEDEAEEPEEEDTVVVESGPVLPAAAPPSVEEEEDAYAEEDEEDEAHVSARDLLTKFRSAHDDDEAEGEGEEGGYEDYYD